MLIGWLCYVICGVSCKTFFYLLLTKLLIEVKRHFAQEHVQKQHITVKINIKVFESFGPKTRKDKAIKTYLISSTKKNITKDSAKSK